MISRKMNIQIPFISFSFSFFIYVHCGCLTIEDNNVIVVLQRQFISHLDRIKSTKHNTVFIVYSLLMLMRKEGWKDTSRYTNNVGWLQLQFLLQWMKTQKWTRWNGLFCFHCIQDCFHCSSKLNWISNKIQENLNHSYFLFL